MTPVVMAGILPRLLHGSAGFHRCRNKRHAVARLPVASQVVSSGGDGPQRKDGAVKALESRGYQGHREGAAGVSMEFPRITRMPARERRPECPPRAGS